ncbi:MAG: glycerophosphodiester phosphodiesterase family protein [Jatrophihabitans sp.]
MRLGNRVRYLAVVASLAAALTACGSSSPHSTPQSTAQQASKPAHFDLEAHRGGRGETTEESHAGFAKSIKLGVTTLELDIVLTKDLKPIIWHDPTIDPTKCVDTKPAKPGDPQYPYVGKVVHDLTYAQIHTLDCGKKLAAFPQAQAVPGNKIALLPQLFALADSLKAQVHYNVETKREANKPAESATPQQFVDVILAAVRAAGKTPDIDIQSFDWSTLPLVHKADPSIPLVALTDAVHWFAHSPFLGSVDYDSVHGDVIAGAKQLGAQLISPDYVDDSSPSGSVVVDAGYVQRAHAAGLKVVSWTVDDQSAMTEQIDAGVDGVITDFPTLLRSVLKARGMPLPTGS